MIAPERIRNFCIIAHIDHGKSTLADRFLEITGTIPERKMVEQYLDMLEIERERGITIKAQPVRMEYKGYVLNLIDTPGHVDFTYEVSRSLAACEGAILVVDATQGVEAQTVANAFLAIESNLEIIPVINKIDLPNADPERAKREIEEAIGLDASGAILASAKEGIGVEEILDTVIKQIPPPKGDPNAPLRALIFDSIYNSYRGVVIYIRVKDGTIKAGQKIIMMSTGNIYEVEEVGIFTPHMKPINELGPGEVGYVIAGIKEIRQARVGDTITDASNPAKEPLPGYKKVKPVVFCGVYPVDRNDFENLRDALEKLRLNDASIYFEPESSAALGAGFRCGFLGMLHMEVALERLRREFELDLIATAPNVVYKVVKHSEEVLEIDNPAKFPPLGEIREIQEPFARVTIFTPTEFVGNIMSFLQERRGSFKSMDYLSPERVMLIYEVPLAEIIIDFHDKLKSLSKGYASMDYEPIGYKTSDLVKVDILIHYEPVDAFSFIVHREKAYHKALALLQKLKEMIPRQLFEVAIQAAIGKKVIARVDIKPLRKDVLAKCYGGDVTRKKKLLEKQKEGKKRMKALGKVNVPTEAFLALMKLEKE
ncbi:MAG: translation elongation factor 4 [Synergistetes bacterium]|nr:translation elongation factor 4 [Synergistota bacterium]MCX8127198.1 translation elongation factor 4 [Synergistota bacterium]MDW8191916.1 translation elongation factor 4 [Synergistota bacterium]